MITLYAVEIPRDVPFKTVQSICKEHGGAYHAGTIRLRNGFRVPPTYAFPSRKQAEQAEAALKEIATPK